MTTNYKYPPPFLYHTQSAAYKDYRPQSCQSRLYLRPALSATCPRLTLSRQSEQQCYAPFHAKEKRGNSRYTLLCRLGEKYFSAFVGADAANCFRRHNPTCLYAHLTSIERSFRNATQVIYSRPRVDNFLKSLKKQGERGIVGKRCSSFHYTPLPYHADSLVMVK